MGIIGLILMLLILTVAGRNITINLFTAFRRKSIKTYNPGYDFALLAILLMSLIHNALYNNAILVMAILFVSYSERFSRKKDYSKADMYPILTLKNWNYTTGAIWAVAAISLFYFMIYAPWQAANKLTSSYEYIEKRDFKPALERINNAIDILPYYTKAHLLRANIYKDIFLQNENLDIAFLSLRDFDRAIDMAPRNIKVLEGKIELLKVYRKSNP